MAESLEHVAGESRGALALDETKFRILTAALREGRRFPPTAFALYYDLVDAVVNDRLDDAERCFAAIAAEKPIGRPLDYVTLDDALLGPGMAARYGRMMDTDAANPHSFFAPPAEQITAFRPLLDESLSLMRRGCPRVHAEFIELVDQIVFSGGTNLANGEDFLAGSSFTLWGAVFLNPASSRTALSLLETLAHEAAHSLLFGIQISGPLVLNPDDERFGSPLRVDLRPMDGVYHATFVCARMHFAMQELLASGLLSGDEAANAQEAAARDRGHFFEGLRTVKKHGRLTPAGDEVMAGAEAYMARAALTVFR
jgi:HEXXH motif-containing protein